MRPAADSWCRWGGRLAACMLSCVLVALLITLHTLYDSAVYTIQYQGGECGDSADSASPPRATLWP